MNQKKITPQQELNNQLGFEKLIREISTYFINLDMNNFEDGIAHGLHQLAKYTGNDQITIFNIDPDIETVLIEWNSSSPKKNYNFLSKKLVINEFKNITSLLS
ncbi:MAG TPA: hypothetical protein VK856_03660, partial [Anaerolineaceae bacterium]|nr:hypothetical protein [Anaerolineaceae bacterium]